MDHFSSAKLTDLEHLPGNLTDLYTAPRSVIPLKADGTVLFFSVPKSWESAANDGERVMFLLDKAKQLDEDEENLNIIDLVQAQLAEYYYGDCLIVNRKKTPVETKESANQYRQVPLSSRTFSRTPDEDIENYFHLSAMKENQSVVLLPNGDIEKIELPPEYNYIELYKKLGSHWKLADIYYKRYQYDKAVLEWDLVKQERVPEGQEMIYQEYRRGAENAIKFFTMPSVQFVQKLVYGGLKNEIEISSRKIDKIHLEIHRIGEPDLPGRGDQTLNSVINSISMLKMSQNQPPLKEWDYNIDQKIPSDSQEIPKNTTSKISVEFPDTGIYVVKINTQKSMISESKYLHGDSPILLYIIKKVNIIHKNLGDSHWFYVADSRTGKPAAEAKIELTNATSSGFRSQTSSTAPNNSDNQTIVLTTDTNGQAFIKKLNGSTAWQAKCMGNSIDFCACYGLAYPFTAVTTDIPPVDIIDIQTDKTVYLPSQTARVCVCARQAAYSNTPKSLAGKSISLSVSKSGLCGTNINNSLTLDENGNAVIDLDLRRFSPGEYCLSAQWQDTSSNRNNDKNTTCFNKHRFFVAKTEQNNSAPHVEISILNSIDQQGRIVLKDRDFCKAKIQVFGIDNKPLSSGRVMSQYGIKTLIPAVDNSNDSWNWLYQKGTFSKMEKCDKISQNQIPFTHPFRYASEPLDDQGTAFLNIPLKSIGTQVQNNSKNIYQLRCFLTVCAVGFDNMAVFGSKSFYCLPDSALDSISSQPLVLSTDKTEYQPGDKMDITIKSSSPDALVWLFPFCSDLSAQNPVPVQLVDGIGHFQTEIKPEHCPNFFVEAIAVIDGDTYNSIGEIRVPPRQSILEIGLKAERIANNQAIVNVQINDKTGKPYSGPLFVSVYDSALDSVVDRLGATGLKERFWGWRRVYLFNDDFGLYETVQSQMNLLSERLPPFVRQSINQYRTFQNIEKELSGLKEGTLAVSSENLAEQNFSTSEFLNFRPLYFGQLNQITAEMYTDSVYWNPRLKTDDSGKAQVTFPLPERKRTWKVRVWAVGPQTQVGEASLTL